MPRTNNAAAANKAPEALAITLSFLSANPGYGAEGAVRFLVGLQALLPPLLSRPPVGSTVSRTVFKAALIAALAGASKFVTVQEAEACTPASVAGFLELVLHAMLCPPPEKPPTDIPAEAEVGQGQAGSPSVKAGAMALRRKPAVRVGRSISPDGEYLVCLCDGKKVKMLRRYIRRFGLTPDTYREAYGLTADYPMTAPALVEKKRQDALVVGLGTARNKAGFKKSEPQTAEPVLLQAA